MNRWEKKPYHKFYPNCGAKDGGIMRIIDNILWKIDELKEDWARFTWHRKHHNVRCQICGEVLDSNKIYWGPKDCGWGQIRGTKMWICHQCLCHRDFKPYIKQKRKENLKNMVNKRSN